MTWGIAHGCLRLRIAAASLACLIALGGAWAQSATVSEQYLLAAANQDRALRGLPPVRLDERLTLAAAAHARSMASRRTISHQFPGEADLARRAGDAGAFFSLITENVAEAPNATIIHDMWMQSPGHRANLLDAQVDTVGIAVVADRGQMYAVEDFTRSVRNLAVPEQEALVSSLVERTGLRIFADRGDARQTCAMLTGYAGARQPWFVMRYTAADLSVLPEQLRENLGTGRFHEAAVGACSSKRQTPFSSYSIAVLLYR